MREGWGAKLRKLRLQAGMKQQTLAEILQISQGYLSRLEAEQIRPRGDVLRRIEGLLGAPEQISLLDQVMLTARLSPHMLCLIEGESPFKLLASSEGNKSGLSPFRPCREHEPLVHPALTSFMEGVRTLSALKQDGAVAGAAGHIWHCQPPAKPGAMRSIHTPVGTGPDRYMWHTVTIAISETEFARTEGQWGGRITLESQSKLGAALGGASCACGQVTDR
ncbi:helix-turn-helix domain-containing protein [Maricaulis sp.]|uniref:helix-turn-helix domain-containing protein n=1 Tax=Maricaulis sp. TaxID=1486257 RepID=UPI003A8F9894